MKMKYIASLAVFAVLAVGFIGLALDADDSDAMTTDGSWSSSSISVTNGSSRSVTFTSTVPISSSGLTASVSNPSICSASASYNTQYKVTVTVTGTAVGSTTVYLSFVNVQGTDDFQSPALSVSVTAPTVYNYTITYNANGGTGAPSNTTATSTSTTRNITLSSVEPTRDGFNFIGWSTSSTATTASYQPGGTYSFSSGTTRLYAVWEPLSDRGRWVDSNNTAITSLSLSLGESKTVRMIADTNVMNSGFSLTMSQSGIASGSATYSTQFAFEVTFTGSAPGTVTATMNYTSLLTGATLSSSPLQISVVAQYSGHWVDLSGNTITSLSLSLGESRMVRMMTDTNAMNSGYSVTLANTSIASATPSYRSQFSFDVTFTGSAAGSTTATMTYTGLVTQFEFTSGELNIEVSDAPPTPVNVYWSNGNYNGRVDILYKFESPAQAHIMSMNLYTPTTADHRTTWTDTGKDLSVTILPSNHRITASVTGGSSSTYNIGTWNTMLISIDTEHGNVSVTPVKTFTDFTDFTLNDRMKKTVLDFSATITDAAIESIAHSDTGDQANRARFSVVDTWPFLDSYGVILQDPSLNFHDYFPQFDSIRVNFYSFALFGDSITINGITYPVTDGKVTVTYVSDDGNNYLPEVMPNRDPTTRTFELNNIYVTFSDDGHVYLTFNDKHFTLDLGLFQPDQWVVSMAGTWYFTSMAYEPYTATEKSLSGWKTLPTTSANEMILIFLGILCVAFAAVAIHVKRSGFGILDLIIIGSAALVAFLLLG